MIFSSFAGVAQLVEQLICNQQVAGSSPIASSSTVEGFLSGQKEQTVNLPAYAFGGSNPPPSTTKVEGNFLLFDYCENPVRE